MDTNETLAHVADAASVVEMDLDLTGAEIFSVNARVGEQKEDANGNAYFILTPLRNAASRLAMYGAPTGRLTGLKTGQVVQVYVTRRGTSQTIVEYNGHVAIAMASIQAAAKPLDLQSREDARKAVEATAKSRANPKAKL